VYLPPLPGGRSWIDARTGGPHPGGRTVTAEAPLDSIPVFTVEGSDIPYA
jgi:alpha-D-xyloside xylohydrolase